MNLPTSLRVLKDPIIAYSWLTQDQKDAVSVGKYVIKDNIVYTRHQNLPFVLREVKVDCVVVCECGDSGLYDDKDGNLIVCPEYFPRRVEGYISHIPSNFKHVFATNCSIDFAKWPQITPLPFGVQSHQLKQIISLLNSGYTDLVKKNLLYVNFQPQTNPIRIPAAKYWRKQNPLWAKINFNVNKGIGGEIDCYLNYLLMSQSAFVLCPEGNGLDSYRIWESLYLGAVPVVKNLRTYKHSEYQKLPFFRCPDMYEMKVGERELSGYKVDNSKLNLEMLTRTYWNNLIKSKLNS